MKKRDEEKMIILQRRQFISGLFAGSGYLGLRSLLLGLPPAFLVNRAMAATTPTYLIFSTRRAADPVNTNVPGTYVTGIEHSTVAGYATPTTFTLGSVSVQAASVWSTMPADLRQRFNFFHHQTNTNAHPEHEQVLKANGSLLGQGPTGLTGVEMIPSAIAQHLAGPLGTMGKNPVTVGNFLGVGITSGGSVQSPVAPLSIKQNLGGGADPAVQALVAYRDQQIDALYGQIKASGTPAQKKFLDAHAIGRDQARELVQNLGALLADVNGNTLNDTIIASVALFASNSAPCAVIGIPFGGDNHADGTLNAEVTQTNAGVAAINSMWNRLKALNMHNQTTFALMNVFGRTLKRNGTGGRDHNGLHSTMLLFGPNVNPGVTGGLRTRTDRAGGEALGINSVNGSTNSPDVAANQTLASAVKTLMKACGMADTDINARVTRGKIVQSTVKA